MVPICYYIGQCCIQCSILVFYLRLGLADIGGNRLRRFISILMGLSVVNNITTACISTTFLTLPNFARVSGRYLTPLWFTYGSLNLLMDLTIWSIPLPSLFSIIHNFSVRKRVLLVLAFAVGIMCWCSAILRISFRKYIVGLGDDPPYNGPILVVLYTAEMSLAMGCVSVATLRPLVVIMTNGFNRLRGKPALTNRTRTARFRFDTKPSFVRSIGHQSCPGGPRTAGSSGENTETTIIVQELMEWQSDDVLDIEKPQLIQQACSCPYTGGDIELGGMVAHAHSCPQCPGASRGTQLQVPAPAATHHSSFHRSSSFSRTTNIGSAVTTCRGAHSQPPCGALPASESTVNLTNADTNSTTGCPKTLA